MLELCRRARDASDGWFDPWRMPGGVDPTGLVKGWAAERAMDEFRAAGAAGALVNAGGDIAVIGEPAPGEPWRSASATRSPRTGCCCVSSSTARARWPRRAATNAALHLIDPHTGEPADGLLAATVDRPRPGLRRRAGHRAVRLRAASCSDKISRLGGYHGFVVYADGTLRASRGLQVGLKHAA